MDVLDEGKYGACFFFFIYIIYSLLGYKKWHGELDIAKTKPKIQNKQAKETSVTNYLHQGSVPVPGPHMGVVIILSKVRKAS